MKKSSRIFDILKAVRLVALLNPKSAGECVTAYEICEEEGIVLEIAYRSAYAQEGIQAISDKYPDALVLAGTVMTGRQAENAIAAGVAGIVSADYIPEVVDICVEKDIMCVPGGLTDAGKQLVRKAERYGCEIDDLRDKYPYQWIYKLFPAFSGKNANIDLARAWRGPYRDLAVVYTGGIDRETLQRANRSDPKGIFCASALAEHIGQPEKMKEEIGRWKEALRSDQAWGERKTRPEDIPKTQVPKIVTIGEMMIRLSPPAGVRLRHAKDFLVHFGGAEANVAVSLAQFGMHSCYVSAFPGNDLGDSAVGALKRYGVDTQFIARKGKRLGIYYLERGHGARPSKVIYDRDHSAVSELDPEDVDWGKVLDGACWFHWSGITPALGDSLRATLHQGLQMARKKGLGISADLNYRRKLWSEGEAREVLTDLMPYVDVLIGNEEDPIRVFDIKPRGTDIDRGELNAEGYEELTRLLADRFGFQKIAITLRESLSASENFWSACLFNGKEFILGPRHRVPIVDRVGTGDAFAAGLIYGFLNDKNDTEALSLGVAAACLKHSILGDFNIASIEEVERIAAGKTAGRIQR